MRNALTVGLEYLLRSFLALPSHIIIAFHQTGLGRTTETLSPETMELHENETGAGEDKGKAAVALF